MSFIRFSCSLVFIPCFCCFQTVELEKQNMQESHEQAIAEMEEEFGKEMDSLQQRADEAVERAIEKEREEHEVR